MNDWTCTTNITDDNGAMGGHQHRPPSPNLPVSDSGHLAPAPNEGYRRD